MDIKHLHIQEEFKLITKDLFYWFGKHIRTKTACNIIVQGLLLDPHFLHLFSCFHQKNRKGLEPLGGFFIVYEFPDTFNYCPGVTGTQSWCQFSPLGNKTVYTIHLDLKKPLL